MLIFDGVKFASQKEELLKEQVASLDKPLKIAAILFVEDKNSQIYTNLKQEAALRVGIAYQVFEFSLTDNLDLAKAKIKQLNLDFKITGIIIQKPSKKLFKNYLKTDYDVWWQELVSQIEIKKDVDGLHPKSLLMPATAKAILEILHDYYKNKNLELSLKSKNILILNRSNILGLPLFKKFKEWGLRAKNWGRAELSQAKDLKAFDLIITATGENNLLTGEMLREGVVVIDAAEPKPDVDFRSTQEKIAFLTPVPGGVGPVTVVCLLENCIELLEAPNP